jgi:outer membrane immunogenic protein
MKTLLLTILLVSISSNAFAAGKKARKVTPVSQSQSMKEDFSTLGDNQVFVDRVQNMDAERKVRIVQNRIVDLNNRVEVSIGYGMNGGGGDSYVTTENLAGQLDFHFSPRWAIGLRYEKYYNELSKEAEAQYQRASADVTGTQKFPDIDLPLSSALATVTFSPIYGKLNLFDLNVAHFDIYTVVGGGQIELRSGSSTVYTGGLGMSVWLSQHFSTRLEARYESYKDLLKTEEREQGVTKVMATIGFLL